MFNNLRQLITSMQDEKSCREYLIKECWNGVITCPHFGNEKVYMIEGLMYEIEMKRVLQK